jgi:hypothetical protein
MLIHFGDVQIKMTSGASVSLYATSTRLVVLKVINSEEAEIVYDGPGEPAWAMAGKLQKNGQRTIRLSKLKQLGEADERRYFRTSGHEYGRWPEEGHDAATGMSGGADAGCFCGLNTPSTTHGGHPPSRGAPG